MPEGLDLAGMLAEHVLREYDDPTACTCGWDWDWREVILPSAVDFDCSRYRLPDMVRPEQHRAHVAAALHAAVAAWLGDESTQERVARAILAERLAARELPNSYMDDAELLAAMRPRAAAALAALTTTDQEAHQ